MYLIDTNIISEARKQSRANPGVTRFFQDAARQAAPLFLSAVTVGELQRGIALVARRGDVKQAAALTRWLAEVLERYGDHILPFGTEAAQIWGQMRAPDPAHALDKQIAATALVYDLTVVTRNSAGFRGLGVRVQNPFTPAPSAPRSSVKG